MKDTPGLPAGVSDARAADLAESRRQGAEAAAAHLAAAVDAVEAAMGEGAAARHPELVASLVQAAAIESAVSTGRLCHREALEVVQRLSRETNETILRLKPRLFG